MTNSERKLAISRLKASNEIIINASQRLAGGGSKLAFALKAAQDTDGLPILEQAFAASGNKIAFALEMQAKSEAMLANAIALHEQAIQSMG